MSIQATTLAQQRKHKATLWQNIRYHQRHGCQEHAELLLKVFKPVLNLRLPRIPRPARDARLKPYKKGQR